MGYSPWGHKESDTTERLSTSRQGPRPVRAKMSALLWVQAPVSLLGWSRPLVCSPE